VKAEYRASFAKDLRKIKDKAVLERIKQAIEQVESSQSQQEITNIKKLRGGTGYYRIRVGDYRIGIIFEEDKVIFVRCLNRKEIYQYFP
jgi:mRNA interferase RelE/StbE